MSLYTKTKNKKGNEKEKGDEGYLLPHYMPSRESNSSFAKKFFLGLIFPFTWPFVLGRSNDDDPWAGCTLEERQKMLHQMQLAAEDAKRDDEKHKLRMEKIKKNIERQKKEWEAMHQRKSSNDEI